MKCKGGGICGDIGVGYLWVVCDSEQYTPFCFVFVFVFIFVFVLYLW